MKTNKQQAMDWFLSNSSGEVTLKAKDGTVLSVQCYPDAVKFFDEHGEE